LKNKIVIIIPALNEEKNIKKILIKFNKIGRIIVINDNSADQTKKIAKKFCYKIINNKKTIGYDQSIRKGITYVLKNKNSFQYLLTIDADGQHFNLPIKNLIKKLDFYDVIICNRNKYNRISEKIINFFSFLLFSIKDPISGVKFYKMENLKKKFFLLDKKEDYVGMFCFKIFNKSKISNLQIQVKKRNKTSSFGDGLKVNLQILKAFFRSI